MLMKANSILLRAMMFVASPTHLLPRLIPLCVEQVRVGNNYTDFVRVTLRR